MDRRPRVILDTDGVKCDFLGPAVEVMNRILGTNFKPEDLKSWHLFDTVECTPEQKKACYDEWKKPGWCLSLPPYPGAKEGVAALQEIADVYVVTSPMDGDTWPTERQRWLKKHFNIGRDHTLHGDAKYICAADVFVDDKKAHCERWRQCFFDGTAVLWTQVTNRFELYDGPRTDNWGTLHTIVANHPTKVIRSWTTLQTT